MSNTYPNFQTLVNYAIVIDNKRKEMEPRRGGFRDRPLGAILIHAPILSKASNRGTRDHPISGIVVSTLSATQTSNIHRISSRMAINALSSGVASRHHD